MTDIFKLIWGFFTGFFRWRVDLQAENVALRAVTLALMRFTRCARSVAPSRKIASWPMLTDAQPKIVFSTLCPALPMRLVSVFIAAMRSLISSIFFFLGYLPLP